MKSSAECHDGRAALHLQPGLSEPAATGAPASTGHWPHLQNRQSRLQFLPQEAPTLLDLGREPQGSNATCLLFSHGFIACFTACLLLSLLGMALHAATTQGKGGGGYEEGKINDK